jgi:carboxyl-terminal processing protease
MRNPWKALALALFVGSTLAATLVGDKVLAVSSDTRGELRRYTNLLELLHQRAGEEVTWNDLVDASIHGMLRELDPHTNFLPPTAYNRMRERQQASFYGLGILVGIRNAQLTVITPIEGTPASRMGLRAGDVIHQIEGEPTGPMTLDEAVGKLKGPKGTTVAITILRPGLTTPLEMTVTRAEIPQNTVRYVSMLDDKTGYFRITDFSRGTGREVEEALASLREQGMQRLVLDLRNNGGGLLDQAIEVAKQFVPKGGTIVETRGRLRDSSQQYRSSGRREGLDLPLVVLVNSGSASAAEILAGAIQDHDLGVVVGTPTWGKGLVQTVYTLPGDAALALTTARYYTPSGRLIQRDYSSWYDYYSRGDRADDSGHYGRTDETPGETFQTDLGRPVRGGGGITPDTIVEPEEIPEITQRLAIRNAFFNFAVEKAESLAIADESWTPDAATLESFSKWAAAAEAAKPEDLAEALADATTRRELEIRIRAELFNHRFGNEAWYRVLAGADNQIQEGLAHFPDAVALLEQRNAAKSKVAALR